MTSFRRLFPILALSTLVFTGCHQTQARSQFLLKPLPGSAHPTYTITDLGVGMPTGINNIGQVVGRFPAGVYPNSKGFPYFHGCRWNNEKRVEMPTLGGWYSDASTISEHGQIIGTATVAGVERPGHSVTHGCFWDGHKLTDLEADPRFRGTGSIHITPSGGVYAVSPHQGPKKQLHLWFFPAGFGPGSHLDKGIIGGPILTPTSVNDLGMVAGIWNTAILRNKQPLHHAFAWHPGDKKWTDLGTFGGSQSEAVGVNNAGEVAGTADLRDEPTGQRFQAHAFL